MQTENRVVEQHKRKFVEFIANEDNDGKYIEKLKQTMSDKSYRFILNINELRSMESDLAAKIIKRPREYMIALQDAAAETAKGLNPTYEKLLKTVDLQVGFEGSLGSNSVSPRGLTSGLLNSLVEVEGIVTKCSSVRPKLVRSVQYCPKTNVYSTREYRDATSLDIGIEVRENSKGNLPTSSTFPTQDDEGNPLETEVGYCQYKDCQTLILQEMPEKARVGQLPRSVEIILEHDLVDHAKPGDRIKCIGVFRSLPNEQNGTTSGVFRTVLMCNNIKVIGKEIGAVRLTGTDVKNIKELAEKDDVLEIMSRSLCPSIFGHEFVKKALILQLLSGCEKNLDGGTHLRGDINVMLVGDPSTAKSQLLRAVLDIAPLAISTTGRGSSGVGLTAAVTMDPETSEKRLEAGAMVLADRGVVCIDEFDKMGENDRVAIHEVMEQQTVTIAKAGIHASLNARCSVLAAANPVYGQYNKLKRPQENIGLPDSLLSRFDLLFIVLDQLDSGVDRRISEHVIKSHQYRRAGTIMEPEPLNQASTLSLDEGRENASDAPMWQRGGRNADASAGRSDGSKPGDVLTKDFLRKYIHYAKSKITPELTDEAVDRISREYSEMRARQTNKNLPITARTLETMIRLSSAAAKARLSREILVRDVVSALELMNFVLFHEVGEEYDPSAGKSGEALALAGQKLSSNAVKKGQMKGGATAAASSASSSASAAPEKKKTLADDFTSGDDSNYEEDEGEEEDDAMVRARRLLSRSKKITETVVDEEEQGEAEQAVGPVDENSPKYLELVSVLTKMSEGSFGETIEIGDLMHRLNTPGSAQTAGPFSRREVDAMLLHLETVNKVMYQDGWIHII